VSVDYRLVDEQIHYPAPVDDVVEAWRWVTTNARALGADGDQIALGGASAGGCLAVSTALRLRDSKSPMPTALLLAYPALHAVLPSLSAEDEERLVALPPLFRFSASDVYEMFKRYLHARPEEANDGCAIPALADLRGLPRTLIVNSQYDRLRASGESFAADLVASGVDVDCLYEPGTMHGHLNTIRLPAAEASLERMATFLRNLGA
jgi:acetyl esterase